MWKYSPSLKGLLAKIVTFVLMKVFTIIFTVFIGFLIIEPSLSIFNASICIEQVGDFDDNGGECNDVCNPFLSCETCLGFMPSIIAPALEVLFIPIPQASHFHYLSQQQIFDIFHPPKLA